MPTIRFNAKESVEMPFSKPELRLSGLEQSNALLLGYIAGDGCSPVLPRGMKKLLQEDLSRSFEIA